MTLIGETLINKRIFSVTMAAKGLTAWAAFQLVALAVTIAGPMVVCPAEAPVDSGEGEG